MSERVAERELLAVDELDERGYPLGYKPSWWACPDCGGLYHDSEQAGRTDIAWGMDAECGRCGGRTMHRIGLIGHLIAWWRRRFPRE